MANSVDKVFRASEYQVIKPVSGRAPIHSYRVQGKVEAFDVARPVDAATGNLMLIEKLISGTEYTIAINSPMISVEMKIIKLNSNFISMTARRIMGDEAPNFTSMKPRPIGADRCQLPDTVTDARIIAELSTLAQNFGMDYDDLIDTIKVDRLRFLTTHPSAMIARESETAMLLQS